ncbi:TPR repeat-containing thioredoxin TTL2 [Apostasia shenzhenica]|uniref:TPR repeat-containing thioredoxin TTL2 n=1 Tax=Apostasia shenzhenica TaxID=1088818 RepID=A0A2I0ASQ0_9ASPA|nr:TPR repeat-containing thioredoxin TTL2 [Apostasia shenzhenica]
MVGKDVKVNQKSTGTVTSSVLAHEACEKWRLRGNQAYADGDLYKAEDYYTRGLNCVSLRKTENCSKALVLCYSNRAATRMSLGRLREALADCRMAIAMDPSFLRAQVRAGKFHSIDRWCRCTCITKDGIHLSLGESGDAIKHFNTCLQSDHKANSDEKILLESADGLEKAKKLDCFLKTSSVFLTKKTSCDATKALEIISEAASISPYSESLLEMKAEALIILRNYEEVIQVCEQSLELAEKNGVISVADGRFKETSDFESTESSFVKFWRWRIISKSYFYLGRLEEACELLEKHEKMMPAVEKYF